VLLGGSQENQQPAVALGTALIWEAPRISAEQAWEELSDGANGDDEMWLRSDDRRAVGGSNNPRQLDEGTQAPPYPDRAAVIAAVRAYGWDAERALCIVARESNWDTNAVSPTDDWGLFQLNRPTWEPYFGAAWDPLDWRWNIDAAYHIYERAGRTFSPWTSAGGC